ncbi:MAG: Rieske 2Fe-2S domain-containing protein [Cyanobacteria bacterium]|nr:Rieske 2Fe-2S domain-containing protein [Cyanobacteriota bacterium]
MPFKQQFDDILEQWEPNRGIEDSSAPPYTWYTDEQFFQQEINRVFQRSWLPVGRLDQVQSPGQYFTGDIAGNPYVVVRSADDSKLYAHHNVCRHKGAIVALQEDDSHHKCAFFQCPFHGWEYRHDGCLKKAPMLGQQRKFTTERHGLNPISVNSWGPLVMIDLDGPFGGEGNPRDLKADVKELDEVLSATGWNNMKFFKRVVYEMKCNWKVFVDNSLDGCYHCIFAHEKLADELDLGGLTVEVFRRSSIQTSPTRRTDLRLGDKVSYCFLYPNLFINRYGNMMDINIVEPLAVDRCRVIFDFYFDYESLEDWESRKRIREDMASSHFVQQQDIDVCESVQKGMQSMSYRRGRYSSILEQACYAFHQLHWHELRGYTN